MAKPHPYQYESITEEIQRFLNRSPRGTQKRLAGAARLEQSGFRHRMQERQGQRFSVEQLGAICVEAEGPTGWPLLRWELAEKIDAILKLVSDR